MTKILQALIAITLLSATSVDAACSVVTPEKRAVIGRFPLDVAKKECLATFKQHVRSTKPKDADLYLECTGPEDHIAYVRDYKLFALNAIIQGCE